MILPVMTIIGLLAYNWRTFSIVWFFFQSVSNKQYTNTIRDLIVNSVFFMLGLDLTIGLIHVNAQQTQKIPACIVAWRNVLPTEKSLVVSFWTLFKVSETKAN